MTIFDAENKSIPPNGVEKHRDEVVTIKCASVRGWEVAKEKENCFPLLIKVNTKIK